MYIFFSSRASQADSPARHAALATPFGLRLESVRTPHADDSLAAPYFTSIYRVTTPLDWPALRLAADAQEVECAQFLHLPQWCDYRLLVCDMDSTLITIECIDEVAAYLGLKEKIAAITEQSMRGELDFSSSLQARVALLKGTPVAALDYVLREQLHYSEGAHRLIKKTKAEGLHTAVVSGGFTFFTHAVGLALGLDAHHSNQLDIQDGCLTGELRGPLIDAQAKADLLTQMAQQIGARPDQAIAMGDGANDLAMMAVAGLSVAYHAKPRVRAAAAQQINHAGLDVLCAWLG